MPATSLACARQIAVPSVVAPRNWRMGPLVAAVHTLPSATRQQLLQLWQDTLQLVQGGSGPRQQAVQACDAGAMTDARTPSA